MPSISMHRALYHDALCRKSPLYYKHWTIDNGQHLDLGEGDKIVAALLRHWLREVAILPRGGGAPRLQSLLTGRAHPATSAAFTPNGACWAWTTLPATVSASMTI